MKIVIVAVAIYPRISPRSFRATELAKEFAVKGHDVTLMACTGKYNYKEFEAKYNVKVKDIGTPAFLTKNSDGKINLPLWKKAIIYTLNRFLEFPDILLLNKVRKKIVNEGDIDLLITVALPFPIHWGAAVIKKRNFKTWVSDCGDPYMGNSIKKPFFYFKYVEKFWCRKTDFITVPITQAKNSFYKEFRDKIKVIPQGFNFDKLKLFKYTQNKIPTFIYAGLFYKNNRDPFNFLTYLSNLQLEFKFIIYTPNKRLLLPFIDKLGDKLVIENSIPRDELIAQMSKADFLINFTNLNISNQLPSKLIDYSLANRPILELTSNFEENEKHNFENFLVNNFENQKKIKNLKQYNIKIVAKKFLSIYKNKNEGI
ncbi:hypothetical protein [Psychroflexus salis]|uniref:Uncharacterized protein n=1 Tax=Psychroflexus salis TaxID=1526574 RepID=A0A916ZNM1_9FLAO|nr:hypothetical protein [Psychroflexus salis]GGE05094.1 hypothetical protein GCM10010831_03450 [Psychroflexus salis]